MDKIEQLAAHEIRIRLEDCKQGIRRIIDVLMGLMKQTDNWPPTTKKISLQNELTQILSSLVFFESPINKKTMKQIGYINTHEFYDMTLMSPDKVLSIGKRNGFHDNIYSTAPIPYPYYFNGNTYFRKNDVHLFYKNLKSPYGKANVFIQKLSKKIKKRGKIEIVWV